MSDNDKLQRATQDPKTLAELHAAFAKLEHGAVDTPSGSKISYWRTPAGRFGSEDQERRVPVLLLVHGYPQSSYMWRSVIEPLGEKFRLFIPDLPGYGHSTPVAGGQAADRSNRRVIGHSFAKILQDLYGSETPVILGGHDRGARTVQRMAVSLTHNQPPFHKINLNVYATVMIDIVPYAAQWEAFKNPKKAVAYMHWPFLAHPLAVKMKKAYGGGNLCRDMILGAISGDHKDRIERDHAVDHYAALFDRDSNLQAAADDYAAGATRDYDEQLSDQENNSKIEVPSLIMYSAKNLGNMHDVPRVWKDWIKPGTKVEFFAVPDGVGHYIPEEAPEQTADRIIKFLKGLGLVVV